MCHVAVGSRVCLCCDSYPSCRTEAHPAGLAQGPGAVAFSSHGHVAENAEGAGDDDEKARMVDGSFGAGEIEGVSVHAA